MARLYITMLDVESMHRRAQVKGGYLQNVAVCWGWESVERLDGHALRWLRESLNLDGCVLV